MAKLFTTDIEVQRIVATGLLVCISGSDPPPPPKSFSALFYVLSDASVVEILFQFVSASQPINALAFIFDGLHFGVSDFSYSALSMVNHPE